MSVHFLCKRCKVILDSKESLQEHLRMHREILLGLGPVPPGSGSLWQKHAKDLVQHQFPCDKCDRVFVTKDDLTKHWLLFHVTRPANSKELEKDIRPGSLQIIQVAGNMNHESQEVSTNGRKVQNDSIQLQSTNLEVEALKPNSTPKVAIPIKRVVKQLAPKSAKSDFPSNEQRIQTQLHGRSPLMSKSVHNIQRYDSSSLSKSTTGIYVPNGLIIQPYLMQKQPNQQQTLLISASNPSKTTCAPHQSVSNTQISSINERNNQREVYNLASQSSIMNNGLTLQPFQAQKQPYCNTNILTIKPYQLQPLVNCDPTFQTVTSPSIPQSSITSFVPIGQTIKAKPPKEIQRQTYQPYQAEQQHYQLQRTTIYDPTQTMVQVGYQCTTIPQTTLATIVPNGQTIQTKPPEEIERSEDCSSQLKSPIGATCIPNRQIKQPNTSQQRPIYDPTIQKLISPSISQPSMTSFIKNGQTIQASSHKKLSVATIYERNIPRKISSSLRQPSKAICIPNGQTNQPQQQPYQQQQSGVCDPIHKVDRPLVIATSIPNMQTEQPYSTKQKPYQIQQSTIHEPTMQRVTSPSPAQSTKAAGVPNGQIIPPQEIQREDSGSQRQPSIESCILNGQIYQAQQKPRQLQRATTYYPPVLPAPPYVPQPSMTSHSSHQQPSKATCIPNGQTYHSFPAQRQFDQQQPSLVSNPTVQRMTSPTVEQPTRATCIPKSTDKHIACANRQRKHPYQIPQSTTYDLTSQRVALHQPSSTSLVHNGQTFEANPPVSHSTILRNYLKERKAQTSLPQPQLIIAPQVRNVSSEPSTIEIVDTSPCDSTDSNFFRAHVPQEESYTNKSKNDNTFLEQICVDFVYEESIDCAIVLQEETNDNTNTIDRNERSVLQGDEESYTNKDKNDNTCLGQISVDVVYEDSNDCTIVTLEETEKAKNDNTFLEQISVDVLYEESNDCTIVSQEETNDNTNTIDSNDRSVLQGDANRPVVEIDLTIEEEDIVYINESGPSQQIESYDYQNAAFSGSIEEMDEHSAYSTGPWMYI